VLLFVPLAIYLTFPTRNYYWDGVGFGIQIEKNLPATALLYPSHLIYNLWGSWLYQLSGWIGLRVRSLYLMQAANDSARGLGACSGDVWKRGQSMVKYCVAALTPVQQGRRWLTEHERADELLRFKDEKHEFIFHSIR